MLLLYIEINCLHKIVSRESWCRSYGNFTDRKGIEAKRDYHCSVYEMRGIGRLVGIAQSHGREGAN